MTERFFPFRFIPRNSKVVLYGAGIMGRQYCIQNQQLQWCEIVGALDKNHQKIKDFPVRVIAPEKIGELEYDYIVIALMFFSIGDEEEVKSIINYLEQLGVSSEKIIYKSSFYLWQVDDPKLISRDIEDKSTKGIRIALFSMGSLGNQVIYLKFYQTIIQFIEDGYIDIYVSKKQREYTKAIYHQQPFLGEVYSSDTLDGQGLENSYDLVIRVEYEPVIISVNMKRLQENSPMLYGRIEEMLEYQKKCNASLPIEEYTNRIRVDRARFLRMNKYTLLSCNGILPINNRSINIYLDDELEEEYLKLNLPKCYITFSSGGGKHTAKKDIITKAWPEEYYTQLVKMIKHAFPQFGLVQLGAADNTPIEGIDNGVFGRDIRLVMHVLKHSTVHIDCESGLVHLATQLGTKCIVLFGPTPEWFFGYDSNENIVAQECSECYDLITDWLYRCFRYEKPRCMRSIKPEYVFENLKMILNGKEQR